MDEMICGPLCTCAGRNGYNATCPVHGRPGMRDLATERNHAGVVNGTPAEMHGWCPICQVGRPIKEVVLLSTGKHHQFKGCNHTIPVIRGAGFVSDGRSSISSL